jgi:hypothetical protein
MIVCTGKPICVLRTDRQYQNFIVELEWVHVFPKGNSGFFVWSDAITAAGQPFTRAIECQVLDGMETASYTSQGDVFSIHGAVMTPDRPHPAGWERCLPKERRSRPAGQWNHYRITCIDGTLKLAVNGEEVSGGSSIEPRKGYLCLESEGSEVHFRNLRIRELPPSKTPLRPEEIATLDEGFRSLYAGLDLSGWKLPGSGEAHWRPNDWRIDGDGKGGPLASEREYGDVVLIADWRWTGNAGEGGVRLRGSAKCLVQACGLPSGSGGVDGVVMPRVRADAPLGEWNRFVITLKGDVISVELNGKTVVAEARLPGLPPRGAILLESGGAVQFANIYVKELP